MNIDDVYTTVGQFGRYQRWMFGVSVTLVGFYAAGATFVQQFACWEPPFTCTHSNGSRLENSCFGGTATSCQQLTFHSNYTTVVSEWGLVCDQSWRPPLAQSAFMFGLTFSCLLAGPLSDRFGRLRVVCLLSALSVVTVVWQALASDVNIYIVARLVNGVVHMGIVLCCFVYQQEMVGPDYRASVGNVSGCMFAAGMMLIALLAWASAHWRHLYWTVALFGAAVPTMWLYLPESPRWYLVRGQRERAVAVLRTIASGNGRPLTRDLSDLRPPRDVAREGFVTLLRTRNGCVWTAVLVVAWVTVNLGFYSLTAATGTVGGDRFVNFAVAAFLDLPAHLLVFFILDRFGRRRSLSLLNGLGALGCVGVLVLPSSGDRGRLGARAAALWLGKLMMGAVFTVVYVHTLEIFPTSVRNRGISVVNVAARLTGVLYPFMVSLDAVWPDLQYVILAGLMFGVAYLACHLPETVGRPLCATIAQMEERERQGGEPADAAALESLLREDDGAPLSPGIITGEELVRGDQLWTQPADWRRADEEEIVDEQG